MKHITSFAWAIIMALIAICANAEAQERTSAEDIIASMKQLSERLQLSPEQEQKISLILSETKDALKKDREMAGGDRWALMRSWRERVQTMDVKIQNELSDAQRVIYAEIKRERREKMMQKMREWRNR